MVSPAHQRRQRLDDDFADLVAKERMQDQHRLELARRHQNLLVEQRTCDELEAYLAERLQSLLRQGLLLEKSLGAVETQLVAS